MWNNSGEKPSESLLYKKIRRVESRELWVLGRIRLLACSLAKKVGHLVLLMVYVVVVTLLWISFTGICANSPGRYTTWNHLGADTTTATRRETEYTGSVAPAIVHMSIPTHTCQYLPTRCAWIVAEDNDEK